MTLFGSILTTITAVADAAAAWYRVRRISEGYRLTKEIEKDIEDDENQILYLRSQRSTGSQLAADRLQKRLTRRQGWLTDLSATSPVPESGGADPDDGGDLRSTN